MSRHSIERPSLRRRSSLSGNVTTGLAHFKAKAGTGDRFRRVELFQK
jgi:hypothetical protein